MMPLLQWRLTVISRTVRKGDEREDRIAAETQGNRVRSSYEHHES